MMPPSDIDNLMYTFDLYRGMQENRLEYIYQGFFDQHITEHLVQLAENNIKSDATTLGTQKRLFFLMVESLQNITRHQEQNKNNSENDTGLFIIRRSKTCYFITTGNMIHRSETDELRKHLDIVNALTPEELKAYYRKTLDEGVLSEKGGAGLGLIGMARKSGNKLEYSFRDIDESYVYFYLNISLNNTSGNFDENNKLHAYFENVAYIHEILLKENIVLNYCGNFTSETVSSLEEIIRAQHYNETVSNKLLETTTLLVENVIQYSHITSKNELETEKTGIIFLSAHEEIIRVSTGYFIHSEGLSVLQDQLYSSKLNDNSTVGQECHLNNSLCTLTKDPFSRIKRHCSALTWGIQPVHIDYSFITLQASICINVEDITTKSSEVEDTEM